MMTQEEFMEVQTLHAAGWTIRQIADHVGYHPATVSGWLRNGSPPATRQASAAEVVIDERWQTRIGGLLSQNAQLQASSIMRVIGAEGFDGSYPTLTRHLRSVRADPELERRYDERRDLIGRPEPFDHCDVAVGAGFDHQTGQHGGAVDDDVVVDDDGLGDRRSGRDAEHRSRSERFHELVEHVGIIDIVELTITTSSTGAGTSISARSGCGVNWSRSRSPMRL
ncbi:MAG TPA: helix-turn-helix domain-containing protein [Ilumatobacteraceae bacterium]